MAFRATPLSLVGLPSGIRDLIDRFGDGVGRPTGRRRVTTLSDLHPADHIAWQRTLYWHHAMVVKVQSSKVKVIEYTAGESGQKGVIKESWVSVDLREHDLFVFDYSKCLEADEVLRRARERLREANYNLISNNCEHFATWAKTGVSRSDQVDYARVAVQLPVPGPFGPAPETVDAVLRMFQNQ